MIIGIADRGMVGAFSFLTEVCVAVRIVER